MNGVGIIAFLLALVVIIVAPLVIILKPGKKDAGQPPVLPTAPAARAAPPPVDHGACPHCHAQVDPSSYFCDKCGAKLQ